MFNFNSIIILFVSLSLLLGTFQQQQTEKKKIKRVKKPNIPAQSDIYFNDIFSEALVGDRPDPTPSRPTAKSNATTATGAASETAGKTWSKIITREAVEDEIKSLNLKLQRSVTTPSGFNSKSQEVRQQFSMLSMLFGIIQEYDTDIRWKDFAETAQPGFADAATQARTPSRQSFQVAKNRKDDLATLVRGGGIDTKEREAALDWSSVVGRRPMMVRLEESLRDSLKGMVSSADEFKNSKDKILQEANMIAAMSHVLVQENMDEADDDGYVDFSKSMGSAARKLIFAIETDDFDSASNAVNRIEQSCNNCHGEWR